MQEWKRAEIVAHLERLRADSEAIVRAGHEPPQYVCLAIAAAEDELARRDASAPVSATVEENAMTRDDVLAVLGPVDDRLVMEIIATGATREELAAARAWAENDEAPISEGRPLPSGRVALLAELIERADEALMRDPE